MKKALLIAVAIMLMAGSAFAVELPPVGYIGIFADGAHSANTVCPAAYGMFHADIWCLPSVNGLQAAEWAVRFPATTVVLSQIKNPNITVELGSLAGGISVAFGETTCQMDWVLMYDLTMMSLAMVPTMIEIIPHPNTLPLPAYQFATCQLGYPIEPCIYLTPLYLCQTGPLGVQETNWGAIKSLF